jgi:hypothetical protein
MYAFRPRADFGRGKRTNADAALRPRHGAEAAVHELSGFKCDPAKPDAGAHALQRMGKYVSLAHGGAAGRDYQNEHCQTPTACARKGRRVVVEPARSFEMELGFAEKVQEHRRINFQISPGARGLPPGRASGPVTSGAALTGRQTCMWRAPHSACRGSGSGSFRWPDATAGGKHLLARRQIVAPPTPILAGAQRNRRLQHVACAADRLLRHDRVGAGRDGGTCKGPHRRSGGQLLRRCQGPAGDRHPPGARTSTPLSAQHIGPSLWHRKGLSNPAWIGTARIRPMACTSGRLSEPMQSFTSVAIRRSAVATSDNAPAPSVDENSGLAEQVEDLGVQQLVATGH